MSKTNYEIYGCILVVFTLGCALIMSFFIGVRVCEETLDVQIPRICYEGNKIEMYNMHGVLFKVKYAETK